MGFKGMAAIRGTNGTGWRGRLRCAAGAPPGRVPPHLLRRPPPPQSRLACYSPTATPSLPNCSSNQTDLSEYNPIFSTSIYHKANIEQHYVKTMND